MSAPGGPRWQGIAVPLLTVAVVLGVLMMLAQVVQLDHAAAPKPDFRALVLKGYPDRIPFAEQALIVEAALWWLCLSAVLWVAGLCAVALCAMALHGATRHDPSRRRLALRLLLAWIVVATVALAHAVVVRDVPLMPARPLVSVLDVIAPGLLHLASLNTALAFVVGGALLLGACLQLLPGVHADVPTRQVRAITTLMYAAAAFLMVWVSATTAMYRLAASLLVADARDPALKLAPTLSLMGGLFLSLLLATVYISATVWLQHRHERAQPAGDGQAEAAAPGPAAFLAAHWPKVVAILMPLLPGAAGTVLQGVAQVP